MADPDDPEVRRADRAFTDAERLRDLIDRGRRTALTDAPALSAERAEELVADVRGARSSR